MDDLNLDFPDLPQILQSLDLHVQSAQGRDPQEARGMALLRAGLPLLVRCERRSAAQIGAIFYLGVEGVRQLGQLGAPHLLSVHPVPADLPAAIGEIVRAAGAGLAVGWLEETAFSEIAGQVPRVLRMPYNQALLRLAVAADGGCYNFSIQLDEEKHKLAQTLRDLQRALRGEPFPEGHDLAEMSRSVAAYRERTAEIAEIARGIDPEWHICDEHCIHLCQRTAGCVLPPGHAEDCQPCHLCVKGRAVMCLLPNGHAEPCEPLLGKGAEA